MKNLYQIREISVLSFNERVLQESEDPRNPLMERLRFLGIFSSNMDEFFKVRVASMHRRIELGKKGMQAVLEVVSEESRGLDERFQQAYAKITAALSAEGVKILTERDLAQQSRKVVAWLEEYFHEEVLPSLVPVILRKDQPFPQLTDGALYFGVKMWGEKRQYAILEIPASLPRFVELPNGNIMYIDDVIRYSLDEVFYIFEYERIEAFEFKISRDAELDIDNDFSEGYVRKMEKVLRQRKGGRPTRLVYDAAMPTGMLEVIRKGLTLGDDDTVIGGARYHNMKDLMQFPGRRPDLAFEKLEAAKHPVLDGKRRPMLETMAERDLLITYPYQSFDHVIRLLREAAIDPRVEEIKMTMYRAAARSQVVNALTNAARNGKRVFVSVELQARFDEHHNIAMAEKLAEEGAQVAFGVPPMKVHSKLLLIKRGGAHYAGLSTGNFNEVTGKLYVDSILLTSDKRLTADVAAVFKVFEKCTAAPEMAAPKIKHLLLSPFNTRRTLLKLIDEQTAKGTDGYIFIKANHLTDRKLIKRIRAAADAGVAIDLVIRTTYAISQHPNIRAISILDRFLEHQRVYIFGRNEEKKVFMSSADLMERNLDWRVEVGFPILDPVLAEQVNGMMMLQVRDNHKARVLDQMQTNKYVENGQGHRRAQYATHRYLRRLYQASQRAAKQTVEAAS